MSTKQLLHIFVIPFLLAFILFLVLATYARAGSVEDAALVSGFSSWRKNGQNFPMTQLKTWLAVTAPKGQIGPQGPQGVPGPVGPQGAPAVIPPLDTALQTALQNWLKVQVPTVVP